MGYQRAFLVGGIVGSMTSAASAVPFASGIEALGGGNYSSVLNESADSVVINRTGDTPVVFNAPTAGTYNFSLGSGSAFQISAVKDAAPGWVRTSTDASNNAFFIPRGVAVNNNPSEGGSFNPYFGRVYVSESRGGTTTVGGAGLTRTTTDGIYVYNAALADAVGQGNTGRTGGMTFGGGTDSASPFRVHVGPDNSVYVTDWSDPNSNLWQTNPNVTASTAVLDSTGRSAAGLNATHGSISDVIVTGTGVNRRIYTTDEDFDGLNARRGSVLRYDIGTNPTFSGAPSAITYDDSTKGDIMINFTQSLVQAPDGTFWISQNRAAGTDKASLIQYDPTTDTVLFNSLTNLGSPDPLRGLQGIAFDPVNDYLALATDANQGATGKIFIFDDDTKTILATIDFGASASGTNRDVAFDAAGNLYVVNSSAERLRVWSPGGPSTTITGSDGSFQVINAVPEPTSLALLGLGGLGLMARRRRA